MGDVAAWLLAASAFVLGAATLLGIRWPGLFTSPSTAVSAGHQELDLPTHVARWSQLHGGFDPSGNVLVWRWLALIHRVARRPARWGVHPTLLSLWGIWLAGACAVTGFVGSSWPLLGGALVLANGLFDGLDGAVAVLAGKISRHGRLIDSLADRASDLLLLAALVGVGASAWVALVAGLAIVLLETTRARILLTGRLGSLTPGERPTRLGLACIGMLGAGAWPQQAHVMGAVAVELTALIAAVSWVLLFVELRAGQGRGDRT